MFPHSSIIAGYLIPYSSIIAGILRNAHCASSMEQLGVFGFGYLHLEFRTRERTMFPHSSIMAGYLMKRATAYESRESGYVHLFDHKYTVCPSIRSNIHSMSIYLTIKTRYVHLFDHEYTV